MHAELSCLCGANRVFFSGEPIFKFRCHCKNELKLSQVGFSNNMLMPTLNLEVIKGALKTFPILAGSGNTITSHFCGDCATLLYRTSDGYPGTMAVKVGCIDDDGRTNAEYVPDIEIFTRSRVPWIAPVESAKQEIGDFNGATY